MPTPGSTCVTDCGQCPGGMSFDWLYTISGITNNVGCLNCISQNGTFTLKHIAPCDFRTDELNCQGGSFHAGHLSFSSGVWTLVINNEANYVIAGVDFDCVGDNELLFQNITIGSNLCQNYPASIIISPLGSCGSSSSSSSSSVTGDPCCGRIRFRLTCNAGVYTLVATRPNGTTTTATATTACDVFSMYFYNMVVGNSCTGTVLIDTTSITPETECNIYLSLVGECSFEMSGSLVYSIGTQLVDVEITDTCYCVNQVLINGLATPVDLNDGDLIQVDILVNSWCGQSIVDVPVCQVPVMLTAMARDGSRKTVLSMANLIKAARRRPFRY